MTISVQQFNAASPADTPYNLVNIADFNSLIAQSQKHSIPVFALTDVQIEQAGIILQTMKRSRDDFASAFDGLSHSIEMIAGI
jgi:chromosome partitioning protein